MHPPDEPWEDDADGPWAADEESWLNIDPEAWRGEVHLYDWPESLAGPEYWLNKQEHDDDT